MYKRFMFSSRRTLFNVLYFWKKKSVNVTQNSVFSIFVLYCIVLYCYKYHVGRYMQALIDLKTLWIELDF